LAEIEAIIDGLRVCLPVFDEEQREKTIRIINGLEALKPIAI